MKSPRDIKAILGDTPYMQLWQAELLSSYLVRHRLFRVLELGTFHGVSACYMAAAIAPYGGTVTTVDLANAYSPHVEELAAKCELSNIVAVREKEGAESYLRELLKTKFTPFDFCYIDAGHQWRNTLVQWTLAKAVVRPGGWILFDDVNYDSWPEVREVWRNVVIPQAISHFEIASWGFVKA